MKKIISWILLTILVLSNTFVFSDNPVLVENKLYYLDTDNNGKIDKLEIEFNNTLTWGLNMDKLFLYSNTWGLSSFKLDSVSGTSIFSSYYLSGNILWINLLEQNNFLTGLVVNNTTSSHLRIKTNAWVGIKDLTGNEIKLLYTSSFSNYANVSFKTNPVLVEPNQEIIDDTTNEEIIDPNNLPETSTWGIDSNIPEISEETGSTNENSWTLNNEETNSETASWTSEEEFSEDSSGGISTWATNNFSYVTKLLFQSPSYVLEKDDSEATIFNCDRTKADCKINYNLNRDLWTWFEAISWDYECQWNFWFSWSTGEETKCNPNTISYPVWEWKTTYKIIQKSNPNNYILKEIKIKNEWFKEDSITKLIYVGWTSSSNSSNSAIFINIPKINIQWGLDENNNCKSASCSLNLSYDIKNSKEACLWSFPGGTYESWTEKKCNPGYIKYPTWEFKASLKVYEIGNESNYKESYLNFSNKITNAKIEKVEPVKETKISEAIKSENLDKISILSWSLRISWVLPNPIWNDNLEWLELENIWNEKVNLKWCELNNKLKSSTKKYKIETDTFLDPKQKLKFYKLDTNLNFKNSGWAKLDLFCDWAFIDNISWNFDTAEWFIVNPEILKSKIISIENQKDKNKFVLTFSDWTSISQEKYNKDLINDLLKQAEIIPSDKSKIKDFITSSFTQKISKQKKWIKIYWTTISNAKILIQVKKSAEDNLSFWDFFFKQIYASSIDAYELVADSEGKYELLIKNPSIGSFEVVSSIKSTDTSNFEIPKISNFDVDNDYIAYINTDSVEKTISSDIDIEAIIELQWKIGTDKVLSKNRIVCYSDACSVNFDWRASKWGKSLQYFWDFGNGKSFAKANPAAYSFSKWKHIVSLKVASGNSENISYFIVEVLWSEEKNTKEKVKINENDSIINTANADDKVEEIASNWFKQNQILYISLLVILAISLLFFILKKKDLF